jgi:hypothetical protein
MTSQRRTGSFPFFRLPLEIRQRILRLLLKPFYRTHNSIRATQLRIYGKSMENNDYDDEYFEADFEAHLARRAEYYEGDFEAHLARQAASEEDDLEEGEQPYIMSAEERQKVRLLTTRRRRMFCTKQSRIQIENTSMRSTVSPTKVTCTEKDLTRTG